MSVYCNDQIVSEDYIDFIADYEVAENEELATYNICHIPINLIYTAVYMPKALVPIKSLEAYGYKVFVRLLGLLDLKSLESSGVTRLRNIPGLNLKGQGVLIGIVDTGIDYTHRAFINADGTTKIVSIWDQSIQGDNPPKDLYYGTEYSRDQINFALNSNEPRTVVPSTDDIGHGTFLAGIAAGNTDIEHEFSGVASDSEIIVVKLKPAKNYIKDFYMVPPNAICYQENDIMLGVKYLIDTAAKLNRPISICIGLGTSQGAHDETGALSTYLSAISQKEGIVVSIGAGNEGNSRHHYHSELPVGKNEETVELNVGPNEPGLYMEIWGDIPNTYAVELLSPGGEFVPLITPRLNERREIKFVFETTVINIYFQLVGFRSGAQLVILRFQNPTEGIWRIVIHKIDNDHNLIINMWLPIHGFIGDDTYFLNSSPFTTLTSPGNVHVPIVVTAYDDFNNNLYINASRGYTRTGRIAPSLAAPGVNVLGPTLGNGYNTGSGTSIAAAHTAGIAALILQWGVVNKKVAFMDGVDVKLLLVRGAQRVPGRSYPSREWGFGIVDIFGVFENLTGI